jgi:hypothetical protein
VYLSDILLAIEHIKTLSRSHEHARQELGRLQREAEYSRRAQEESDVLRAELNACWTALRRIDPNNPHVYGSCTSQLAHGQPATPASSNNVLPPLNPQQQVHSQPPQGQWGPPQATAMQGIEFGGMRPYEHSHR